MSQDDEDSQILEIVFLGQQDRYLHNADYLRISHKCPRPVFLKTRGIAKGKFAIEPHLSENLKVGVFAGSSYDAWVRFSGDGPPFQADNTQLTAGMAIKLFDVSGDKLLDDSSDTQDFLLQNHPVFFVDTAHELAVYYKYVKSKNPPAEYGPIAVKAQKNITAMEHELDSVLGSEYWSAIPYAFGLDRFVKYKLEPIDFHLDGNPHEASEDGDREFKKTPDYLTDDLRYRLQHKEAKFRFLVQFQKDPQRMPLDAATVEWSEADSTPELVATLTIVQQNIDIDCYQNFGDNLAFNPWRCLQEHEPQGSIAHVRKGMYRQSARMRHQFNSVPDSEPSTSGIIWDEAQ